jgi:acyl-coenzyme A thioesterase PaaI-like protein
MVGMNAWFKRHIRSLVNFWPPLLGAGIRVTRWDPDWRAVDVEMPLHRRNANFVGTHYGGSLYSMADPFYMLMLIENLGPDYVVWDKSASIRFRRPGKGRVQASFRLTQEQIDDIRQALSTQEKLEPTFTVEIKDDSGTTIAEVQKLLHIKKAAG